MVDSDEDVDLDSDNFDTKNDNFEDCDYSDE